MAPNPGRVVLRDDTHGTWRHFAAPRRILTTHQVGDVVPLLEELELAVERDGLHAAGFIGYEAAPAFDPALAVRPDGGFPLVWFGLFEEVTTSDALTGGGPAVPTVAWEETITPEDYRRCLAEIHDFIRDGDTYQVNFTYRQRARTAMDPWAWFVALAGDGAAPYAAFVDTGEWAVCSASPELFLRRDGEHLESRPMKGTSARGLWPARDLALKTALEQSIKERAENLMIVDMVRNDLGRVARPGSVVVPRLFDVEKYPSVWQLTSTVRALSDEPLARILAATFPPASITGAPKRRTMEIIARLEASPRRIYTGTIGCASPGRRAQFNVAIRTVLVHRPSGRAEYGVGGGIVWDSKPDAEHAECRTKTKVLTPAPRDFDLLETLLWSPNDGYKLLEPHLQRLAQSADYFGFHADLDAIRKQLAATTRELAPGPQRIRLRVARHGGIRCEASPLAGTSMTFADIPLAKHPVDPGDLFLYHKTTRRDVYEQALRSCPGSADVLLFNTAGQLTESTVANVAVEIDGVLYTPPVSCGLLPGTQRAWMLEQGLLRERVIDIREALASQHLHLFNSVRGMHKVRCVQERV